MNPNIAATEVLCQEDANELKEERAENFQIDETSDSGGWQSRVGESFPGEGYENSGFKGRESGVRKVC